jgi:predicted nuclease of predicted toxin-antitoxin system
MPKYLIDVNLPYYFKIWKSVDYVHQNDLNDQATDEEIWEYAKKHNMTIITKDSDFSNKILFHQPPPKIIHIKLGNLKMNDFYLKITSIWDLVLNLSDNHKLVSVYQDRIEGLN